VASQAHRRTQQIETEAVRFWPAALALVLIGVAYGVLPDFLREGPRWLLPVVAAVLVLCATAFRWRGHHTITAWLARAATVVVTLALAASVILLVTGLHRDQTGGVELLSYAVLLWTINVFVFALWYWEVDSGGPRARHTHPYGTVDFAFPQFQLVPSTEPVHWHPGFLDYLFFAFNTSTAFSPTDTMIMSQRAKLLMMSQSSISLVVLAVLAARAVSVL
jgi:hypothetical protein